MSVRRWLWGITFVAAAATVSVCLLFFLEYKQSQADHRQHATPHNSDRTDNQPYDPCENLKTRDSVIDSLNCVWREIKAERNEERAEYDLQAQQDMAVWALGMLFVSMFGLLATIVGVVYVALTLRETRRIGEAQVRAYLSVESASYVAYPNLFEVTIVVKNSGNSPARQLKMLNDLSWNEPKVTIDDVVIGKHGWQYHAASFISVINDIPASGGGIGQCSFYRAVEDDIVDRIARRMKSPVWIRCALSWRDVFGKESAIHLNLIGFRDRTDGGPNDEWKHKGELQIDWQWEADSRRLSEVGTPPPIGKDRKPES